VGGENLVRIGTEITSDVRKAKKATTAKQTNGAKVVGEGIAWNTTLEQPHR